MHIRYQHYLASTRLVCYNDRSFCSRHCRYNRPQAPSTRFGLSPSILLQARLIGTTPLNSEDISPFAGTKTITLVYPGSGWDLGFVRQHGFPYSRVLCYEALPGNAYLGELCPDIEALRMKCEEKIIHGEKV